jgi:predicted dehydrogenase
MLLSFAIIGCGNIAKRHAEQIQTFGKLVAVCDIIRSKAEELGKKYNVEVFSSIEELFANKKGIDVAVICSPNGLHAAHSIISLQAGCHVLCEKPMGDQFFQLPVDDTGSGEGRQTSFCCKTKSF